MQWTFRVWVWSTIMSIRKTFHRFVICNVVLVYEKLSLLRQYSTWYFVPVWTTFHGYSLWNLVFKREIICGQNLMYDYHENFVLSKEIIFKSLRCFIILLNTYYIYNNIIIFIANKTLAGKAIQYNTTLQNIYTWTT